MSYFFIKFAFYGVYYWVPTYLQDELGYTQVEAGNITSWGSTGGIIGSLIMGFLSDVLVCRSPVHLLGCIGGALSLSLLTTVRDQDHTTALAFFITSFNVFENGATVVIGILLCDIGKDQVVQKRMKALATISGICDGIAGFGSILGQLLVGPVDNWIGWTGAFGMFSIASIIAIFPALPFTLKEIRKWLCPPRPLV